MDLDDILELIFDGLEFVFDLYLESKKEKEIKREKEGIEDSMYPPLRKFPKKFS